MEKRAFERVPENLHVDFLYKNKMYEGTVTDLSHNGLHIYAETCPPYESYLEIVFVLGDEDFRLPARVKRLANNSNRSCSMGVELLPPSSSYCRLVSTVQDYFDRMRRVKRKKRGQEDADNCRGHG